MAPLDLFAPPPPVANNDLLKQLLADTFRDASLLVDVDLQTPEIDPNTISGGLYRESELLSDDGLAMDGWLVDIEEVEKLQTRPSLPPASEFTREKLAENPTMAWLLGVECILIAPQSDRYDDQLAQFFELIDLMESQAFIVPETLFPRRDKVPYTARKGLGVDTETTGLDTRVRYKQDGKLTTRTKLVSLGFAPTPNLGYYLPIRNTGDDGVPNWRPDVVAAGMEEVFRRFLCVFHNAGYDLEVLALNGVQGVGQFPYILDTLICSYNYDINSPVHGLKVTSERILKRKMVEIAELFVGIGGIKKNVFIAFEQLSANQALVYGCSDPMNTIALFWAFSNAPKGSNSFLEQPIQISLDHTLIDTVRNMVRTGLPINYEYFYFATMDAIYRQMLLGARIEMLAGGPINVGSQPQLNRLLFGKLGMKPLPGMKLSADSEKKIEAGVPVDRIYSLDERAIAALHAAYPEVELLDLIVRFRKISTNIVKIYTKLLTNSWTDAFQPYTRVKLAFSYTSTSTGRFASAGNKGRYRATVKAGKTKKQRLTYVLNRDAWEAGVNAQGLPAKIPFRTAKARRISALPEAAGINLDRPYPPAVFEAFIRACAEL